MKYFVLLVLLIVAISRPAAADVFDDAQLAAQEGRYNDVVSILSAALESGELNPVDMVIAYSNRGIAYSLLKAYGLAKQDLRAAIEMDPDHSLTQNHLGILAEHVDGDLSAAARWYSKGAANKFPASQVNLGNLYLRGVGVQRNYREALSMYQQAAFQNYSLAYVPIGEMYQDALGVKRNYEEALKWFRQAAESGVPAAHYHLGKAYERGLGVEKNFLTAVRHYETAAMQGHGEAQNALGYLYRRGSGVKQNFEEAMKWYRLAADQGVRQAMNRMAWLLATCPVDRFCDGPSAIELAQDSLGKNPSDGYLDTLAAAHARAGQFDEAIAVVEKILQMLPADSSKRNRYQRRLSIYQKGVPYQL